MTQFELVPSADATPCRIAVQPGLTRGLDDWLADVDADRVVILHDPVVEAVANRIAANFGAAAVFSHTGGEGAKTMASVSALCSRLLDAGCSRRSLLINVGGGVVTDLGGFVASVYMRGIRFVHVPTTLLGMCDAAIGGKTGVDLDGVKNAVGVIRQPTAVAIDPDVLETLPDERLKEGLVEAVKMAAILDDSVLAWFESNLDSVLRRDGAALLRCVTDAVRMKVEVVRDDTHERGRRALLNFGHTVGHALEAASGYLMSHGEAVARGMIDELAILDRGDVVPVDGLLERMGMPTTLPPDADLDALWLTMQKDKKASAGTVRIAVPSARGQGEVVPISRSSFVEAVR